MLEESIKKIEEALAKDPSLDAAKKGELLRLVASLKTEVAGLSKTHAEDARSIAGMAGIAAHEATRRTKAPHLIKHALEGLALSTEGFEASHPRLVKTVNDLCSLLARVGI